MTTLLRTCLATLALTVAFAPSAHAVVGGQDASEGEYPYVAHVTIDKLFGCTGTLVDPTHVVTAGHCSSLTGVALATPIGQPGQLIDVQLDSIRAHEGEGRSVPVAQVHVHPNYVFLNDPSYDVAVLELAEPVEGVPTVKVAGADEEGLWSPGTMATIAGFGVTSEGGDPPDVLQEAQVPITTDAYAADAYDSFENRTQIGAGYPQGGTDTCQGDSGGPLLVPGPSGFRLAGDTSYGDGCARPGKPGIYGRVGDDTLREWIRSVSPDAVAGAAPAATSTRIRTRRVGAGSLLRSVGVLR
jgi:secreted trypsin-like serine protease